jgi:hypothetical protein
MSFTRFGKRWTINECLQLEREYDLLKLSIDDIAERHKRTVNAIMIKLDSEELADYNVLYSNYFNFKLNPHTSNKKITCKDECEYEEYKYVDDSDVSEEDDLSLKLQVVSIDKKITYLTNIKHNLLTKLFRPLGI